MDTDGASDNDGMAVVGYSDGEDEKEGGLEGKDDSVGVEVGCDETDGGAEMVGSKDVLGPDDGERVGILRQPHKRLTSF